MAVAASPVNAGCLPPSRNWLMKTTSSRVAATADAPLGASARRPEPPVSLQDVALIDARGSADAGCISVSQWYSLVAEGKAPAPVIRAPRCTRWRLADVRQWLIDSARGVATDTATVTRAKRASSQASIKRRATASVGA
jgi:predicted DNA-binding transcriptional regulator AlpA